MKNLERNGIVKKIISILLILAIALPYFPISVFAAGNDDDDDIIEFDANWNSGVEVEEGTTNDSFGYNFSLTFNKVTTGFQNVTLEMKTDSVDGAYDTITLRGTTGAEASSVQGSGYALLSFGNVNQGTSISGQASVTFKNTAAELDRKLILVLKGEYKDPSTGEICKIEETFDGSRKELQARVKPATAITEYKASVDWSKEKDSSGKESTKNPTLNKTDNNVLYGEAIFGTENKVVGWYTTGVRAVYPVKIYSAEKTQKLELKVTINRCTNEQNVDTTNRMSEGYTINWDGLDTDLGTPTATTNADGSVTYTFTKGTDSNTYNSETAFVINKDYNISILYNTPNTNPKTVSNAEFKTHVSFNAQLNTIGFKLSKEYDSTEQGEKITVSDSVSSDKTIELYSYTPGQDAWIKVNKYTASIGDSQSSSFTISNEIREKLKNNRTADVNFDVSTTLGADGQRPNVTGYINVSQPKLQYVADNGSTRTISLTANQMRLKSISESYNLYDTVFVNGGDETAFDGTYNATGSVNSYTIKLVNFLRNPGFDVFNLKYTLNVDELGLSDTEIDNITYISAGFTTSNSNLIDGFDTFTIRKSVERTTNDISYMELDLGDNFDTTTSNVNIPEEKTIKLKMYKNRNVFVDTANVTNYVVDVNPRFYVSLPGSYDGKVAYDIDPDNITLTTTNRNLSISDLDLISVNGEDYLIIGCSGTYNSRTDGEADVNIKLTRTLLDPASKRYTVNAYMLTDNENYYNTVNNVNQFGEESPETIFLATGSFNVVGVSKLTASTTIERSENNQRREYQPSPSNSLVEDSEKEQPLVVESNSNVIFNSKISSEAETLKDITMLSRLPMQNNTFIEELNNTHSPIIESDYQLPDSFYDAYGDKVNGNPQGSAVTQIDLTNLNILGLYKSDSSDIETAIDSSKYTIYVTNQADATFDSTTFVEYQEGVTDLSQVKNIKVVLNSTETVSDGESLILKYEMTMPNQSGMVGAETAVKYTKVSDNSSNTLYSPAAYVINGDTSSDVKVQKTFENYPVGVAPQEYGVNSLAGIKFKLQYYDEASQTKKFLQDSSNNDIEATTDANGVATFGSIPSGRYYLYEVTEFTNYSGIDLVYFNVNPAETKNVTANNKLKRGNIDINKTWQGETNSEADRKATFTITRINRANEDYDYPIRTVTTQDNKAIAVDLPYGDYAITETKVAKGWAAEVLNKNVTVDDQTITENYNNIPGKGILRIEKTVPEGETVDGLTFHITGHGIIENPETLNFNINTDLTVKIGDTNPSNVTIEKENNDTKAIITISDLYLGYYNIEEIDIPYIDDTQIEKYSTVSADAEILTHDLVNPVVVKLSNNYKSGTLKIVKTAEPGVELDQFKVRVKCDDTLYHTSYDKTFDIPASGVLYVSGLYLGNYTVTEVESDYFNAKYGDERTSTPITAEVNYNRTTTATIYNENANGYVKILKSLEGKDASKALGIKFRLYGKDTTGADVNQIIEITDTEVIEGVKYGVGRSQAIQAGGEYELVELEETVPQFFIEMNPMKVDIKKQYTESNPLELKIENKRGKGNLEMTTKTIPEGGPLSPITYAVSEVELSEDENGKQIYNKIGGEQLVEGISGFGELFGIDAGYYLVELRRVPDGYSPDVPQIVEVPIDETGYAEFEIERNQIGDNTSVVIEKEFLKANGQPATAADIQAAKLDANESFEVKLVDSTGKEYFVFFDGNNPGNIKGLASGRYEIEEIFKPKYSTYSYQIKDGENYVAIQKDATDGKYYFDIPEVINNEEVTVNIKVQNVLDTEFGFGGQDSIDNLSTVVMSEVNKITKTVIYVTDENGNALTGVGIKLFKDGEEVTLPYENNTYVTNGNKKVKINALPAGTYTVKVVSVPEGYVVPADKELKVYEGATMVARIEVWEDKPVGSLKLSTTYTDENGKIFVPRSKYKILDPETGRVLTFEKTASGNYVRSKLPTATDTISLRAGSVEVTGIEVGNYQLGLVDLTEKYGVINTEPEDLTIVENTVVEKEVAVKERTGFKKLAYGQYKRYAISEEGRIYLVVDGNNSYSARNIMSNGPIAFDSMYPELSGVKFVDMVIGNYDANMILLDENGKVWTNTTNSSTFVCISDIENHPFNDAKVEKIAVGQYGDYGALDENGKLWYWGNNLSYVGSYTGISGTVYAENPVCISDGTILENVEIDSFDFGDKNVFVLDKDGKLYSWGDFSYKNTQGYESNESTVTQPVCVTEKDESNLKGKNVKYVSAAYSIVYFIDNDGELWVCGSGDPSGYENAPSSIKNPICLTTTNGNPLSGKKIEMVKSDKQGNVTYAIDSDGKLWGWCDNNYGYQYLGYTDSTITGKLPVCISDLEENELDTVKLVDVTGSYDSGNCAVICIDENGQLWSGGAYGSEGVTAPLGYAGIGDYISNVPKKVNFPQDSYFDLMEIRNMSIGNNSTMILDKTGKLWTTGNVGNRMLYNANYGDSSLKNYNSKELGTYIENITVKDYIVGDNAGSIILDSDNKLWITGLINNRYVVGMANNSSNTYESGYEYMKPMCWSDIEDSGIAHKNIKYIAANDTGSNYNVIGVIDDQGKLYTAGDAFNTYNLGYVGDSTVSRYTKFECLNDKYSSLSNVKFEKVYFYDDDCAIAVTSDGDVYVWGNKSYISVTPAIADVYNVGSNECIVPTKITFPNNAKIVDAICSSSAGTAIDDNGNVYILNRNAAPELLTNDNNLLGGKKIVKIGYGYNGYVYAVDSNGEVIEISQADKTTTRSITSEYDIVAKDIFCSKDMNSDVGLVVIKDTDDILWAIGNTTQLGLTGTTSEPIALNGNSANDLYGKTIKEVKGDWVIVQEGEYERWYKMVANKVKDSILIKDRGSFTGTSGCYIDSNGDATLYYGNGIYNIDSTVKFSKVIPSNSSTLLVGENKKLYKVYTFYVGYNAEYRAVELTGFNDVEDVWTCTTSNNQTVVFAQDSNNKLWFKVAPSSSTTTTGTDFASISGISGITNTCGDAQEVTGYTGGKILDFYVGNIYGNMTTSSSPADINKVFCLDENHNLWAWGTGYIGNTSRGSRTPITVLTNAESVPTILADSYLCKDTNDKLWLWGVGYNNVIGTGSATPRSLKDNVDKYLYVSTNGLADRVGIIKDNDGNIWTWGRNYNGLLGIGQTTNHSNGTPKNVSSITNMGVVKDFAYINQSIWVINENNDIYYWGGYNSLALPELVEQNFENARFEGEYGYSAGKTTSTVQLVTESGKKYNLSSNSSGAHLELVDEGLSSTATDGTYTLTKDGKLYYRQGGEWYCINQEREMPGLFKKEFVLIKDAKYND